MAGSMTATVGPDVADPAGPVATSAAIPSPRARWGRIAGGLVAGIVAAGAAGTSTKTIDLGAVWAGTGAGVLIVVMVARLTIGRARRSLPRPVLGQVTKAALRQTVAWALGSYVFWFLIIQPSLVHAGIYVPMFR